MSDLETGAADIRRVTIAGAVLNVALALAKPGISGWARPGAAAVTPSGGFGSSPENGRCLRELHLARALYACGDHEGVAKKILETYAADGRGVFALHARAVLGQSK